MLPVVVTVFCSMRGMVLVPVITVSQSGILDRTLQAYLSS